MNKKNLIFFLLIFFLNIKISASGKPQVIYGDWYFFKYVTDTPEKELVCYIMTIANKRYDNLNNRGESFFTIVKTKDNPTKEIFFSIGINYNKNIKNTEIDISKYKFPIFIFKDKGWAYNKTDDLEIINKIKDSLFFSISVNYENNKNLLDVFSSVGFSEALEALETKCR